jgi:long-chain acyl-CoA synthetase
VVGVPDTVLGQRVFGFVKLAKGQRPAVVLDILDNLSSRLAGYKVPEQLFVLDALPRNALSKVDRKALQGMATSPGLIPDVQTDAPLPPEKKRVAAERSNRVVPAR